MNYYSLSLFFRLGNFRVQLPENDLIITETDVTYMALRAESCMMVIHLHVTIVWMAKSPVCALPWRMHHDRSPLALYSCSAKIRHCIL